MAKTLDFRHPHLLRDDVEYKAALKEVESLMALDSAPGTPDYERLDFLTLLVERYEEDEVPIDRSSPQDLIDFMLEQRGLNRSDINDIMGGKSRVSEFFAGKRDLSLNQIKALREALGIPADLLIGV